ncbi:hypothetical protein [Fodinibius sp. AD559]|uniref:hypothetical protein n=1 Tax=Fodinibius sp. AD559 TaxID=3424179 RepID=UPI004046D5FD
MKDYTPFLLDQYGRKETPNLFAVHFKKLNAYNEEWTLSQILVYELMLVMSRRTGNTQFYKQLHKIVEDTRLGKYKVRKAIEFLEDLGILSTDRSQGAKTMYSINYDWITDNLEKVYNFTDVEEGDVVPLKQTLTSFINYHSSTDYYEGKPGNIDIDPDDLPKEQSELIEKEKE